MFNFCPLHNYFFHSDSLMDAIIRQRRVAFKNTKIGNNASNHFALTCQLTFLFPTYPSRFLYKIINYIFLFFLNSSCSLSLSGLFIPNNLTISILIL